MLLKAGKQKTKGNHSVIKIRGSNVRGQNKIHCRTLIPLEKMTKW